MILLPKEHDTLVYTWQTVAWLPYKNLQPRGVSRPDEGCQKPLFAFYVLSMTWQTGGDHFSMLYFQKLLFIHSSLLNTELRHSLLLVLRTYSCFSTSFFSSFQLVETLWGSRLEHLLISLPTTSRFSPTVMVPPITCLKGNLLDCVQPSCLQSTSLSCLQMSSEYMLSHVRLFVTPWTVAHQAPLSMEFSRQEYWSR